MTQSIEERKKALTHLCWSWPEWLVALMSTRELCITGAADVRISKFVSEDSMEEFAVGSLQKRIVSKSLGEEFIIDAKHRLIIS